MQCHRAGDSFQPVPETRDRARGQRPREPRAPNGGPRARPGAVGPAIRDDVVEVAPRDGTLLTAAAWARGSSNSDTVAGRLRTGNLPRPYRVRAPRARGWVPARDASRAFSPRTDPAGGGYWRYLRRPSRNGFLVGYTV